MLVGTDPELYVRSYLLRKRKKQRRKPKVTEFIKCGALVVGMDVGITYEAISEVVAVDMEDDTRLPSDCIFLGQRYQLPQDKELFRKAVRSKIWCSYRKGFKTISKN